MQFDTAMETDCVGMGNVKPPDSSVGVIFGAGGDLTARLLMPAFYELHLRGLLPEPSALIGFSQGEWTDDGFRAAMRTAVAARRTVEAAKWDSFARRLFFVPGSFESPATSDYARLNERIDAVRREASIPDNVFFHLAVPPLFFGTIAERLGAAGMAKSEGGWKRLVVEKPYGEDLQSARELDRRVRSVFDESQIYRIDHFLGKETVQNLLVFRFANPSFEPIWNRNFVDHVQITVAESIGIGSRGSFYDRVGVVRDMLQNHLLQLLCMIAIEPPVAFDAPSLRNETIKVLEAVQVEPMVGGGCVLGQYAPGRVGGEEVSGYRQEPNIPAGSHTPTFVACKLALDNWRWAGVPFYLKTGKRQARTFSEIAVEFKPTPHLMFPVQKDRPLHRSVLAFRLQPEEGIIQTFAAKQPGPEVCIRSVRSKFLYADAFGIAEPAPAYAWLLLDVMQGEQTLFARSDWIERAWSIVDPLLHLHERGVEVLEYAAGTNGPAAADELLRRDGREWREI